MVTVTFEQGDRSKHIVVSLTRILYIMTDPKCFTVVDPYMVRADSSHATFDDAVAVASLFVVV